MSQHAGHPQDSPQDLSLPSSGYVTQPREANRAIVPKPPAANNGAGKDAGADQNVDTLMTTTPSGRGVLNPRRLPSLELLNLLDTVVECGSFSQAAKKLHSTQATVSRQIQHLEDLMGFSLLMRNSRSIVPTEHGSIVLRFARASLSQWQSTQHELARCHQDFNGQIHICAPELFAQNFLSLALAHFSRQHPQIAIKLTISEQPGNLIEKGLDIAIKSGPLADSSNYYSPLCKTGLALVAAPTFLSSQPDILSPRDLAPEWCHAFRGDAVWHFTQEDETYSLKPCNRIQQDTPGVLLAFILAGAGFSLAPRWLATPYFARGQLVECLAQYQIKSLVSHFCEMNFILPYRDPPVKLTALMNTVKNTVNQIMVKRPV